MSQNATAESLDSCLHTLKLKPKPIHTFNRCRAATKSNLSYTVGYFQSHEPLNGHLYTTPSHTLLVIL